MFCSSMNFNWGKNKESVSVTACVTVAACAAKSSRTLLASATNATATPKSIEAKWAAACAAAAPMAADPLKAVVTSSMAELLTGGGGAPVRAVTPVVFALIVTSIAASPMTEATLNHSVFCVSGIGL